MKTEEIKETTEEKQKMRKINMKLFPIHKMLSWDFLFYYTIIDRYLMNFTNKEIDTQINAVYNLSRNVVRVLFGFLASFILGVTTSANALIIVGIIFTIIFIVIGQYMKTRLGLKPEEYSKEEKKYDELKEKEIVWVYQKYYHQN